MQEAFIWSQILMFISMVLTFIAFQVKHDKYFRIFFVLSGFFTGFHFILLGAYTAATMIFISSSRWLVSIFSRDKYWFWFYIILFSVSLYFTYSSWISILPFAAVVFGTIAVFKSNQLDTRRVLLGVDTIWVINNILVFTPVGIISHLLFIVSGFVGYRKLK